MIRINEADFPLKDGGTGRIAIFMYAGDEDPRPILEAAIDKYTEGSNTPFITLADAGMNCPWVRVVVSDIDRMEETTLEEYMRTQNREERLKELGI